MATTIPDNYVDPQNQATAEKLVALSGDKAPNTIPIADLRRIFNKFQAHTPNPNVDKTSFEVQTTHGKVKTFLYKPKDRAGEVLPVVLHLHGGGWFLGNAFEFEPFLDDLVLRTRVAILFPEYTLAPDETFPVQQEQCFQVLEYIVKNGHKKGLNVDKVVITGDSAGNQLAVAVSILADRNQLPTPIVHQVLINPIVDLTSLTSTFSEFEFQNGPILTLGFDEKAVNLYTPDQADRSKISASPILMTNAEIKKFIPPTTIITSSADPLRDEGEEFAAKLQGAGVRCGVVRGIGVIHDTVVWAMTQTNPTARILMTVIAGQVKQALTGVDPDNEEDAPAMTNGKKRASNGDEKSGKKKRKRRAY